MYVCMYVCMYICICIYCVRACLHIYRQIEIHTDTQADTCLILIDIHVKEYMFPLQIEMFVMRSGMCGFTY